MITGSVLHRSERIKRILKRTYRKSKKKQWPWLVIFLLGFTIVTFPKWIHFFYPLPYYSIVLEKSVEYRLDPGLIYAVMWAESRFDHKARSPVGAKGLMQIMPETAWWIGAKMGWPITEENLEQPEINIELGCWYLAYLEEEFHELPLVIAAYNAGHNRVRGWLEEGVWDGSLEQADKIPFPETRNYLKQVLRNLEVYRYLPSVP